MTGAWNVPSEHTIRQTLGLITDPFMRARFFEELENPEWLAPLRKIGVFDTPDATIDKDASGRPVPWPEGTYLARVAAHRPKDVTELLVRRATSTNPWVRRAIVDAAATLPPEFAKQLVPAVARIVESESGWLDLPKIMSIVERLAAAGEERAARRLLAALFAPTQGDEESIRAGMHDLDIRIDAYFYTSLMPRVVPVLAGFDDISGLKLAAGWLMVTGPRSTPDEDPPYDPSTSRRPSIAPHAQNFAFDEPEDALIDATRDVALLLSKAGQFAAAIEFLNGAPRFLLRRIGLEVAALIVEHDPSSEVVAQSFPLLMDTRLLDFTARPDYIHLARALLPKLDDEARAQWTTLIGSNDWLPPEEALRRLAAWRRQDPDSVTDGEITRERDLFRLRLLQPLEHVLPPSLRDTLIDLRERYGQIEHPEFSSYHESFVGPTSPASSGELGQMSATELAQFLETFQPAEGHSFGPSVEGLARQLQALAADEPELVASLAPQLIMLGRSYVRAALDGWAKAVPTGYRPSDAAWTLVADVVSMSDEHDDAPMNFDEHDAVWRYAQQSALTLITAVARVVGSDAVELARLWTLVRPLTDHPIPDRETTTTPVEGAMDPMTDSLNQIRPQALRAAIQIASASRADGHRTPIALETDILKVLGQHVGVDRDGSLSVAAVIGEGIGRIWDIEHSWVDDRADVLFSVLDPDPAKRAWADVVTSVALRSYLTGKAFFTLIRPALTAIFSQSYREVDHIEGWRDRHTTIEATAHHLLRAYAFSVIEFDDPEFQRLFSDETEVSVKSEAIGFLGWQFMHWKNGPNPPSPGVVERAETLIEWRVGLLGAGADVAELSQFFWWARSGVFSPSWWLPVLKVVVDNEVGEHSGMLGEALLEASAVELAQTFDIVDRLLTTAMEPGHLYDISAIAPPVISLALDSDDGGLVSRARDLLDRLGRAGDLRLVDAVEMQRHASD